MKVQEAINTMEYNAKCRQNAYGNNLDFYSTDDLDEAFEIVNKKLCRYERLSKCAKEYFDYIELKSL
ncbi:MAG: hypothetical protein SVO01_07575 [Thermotogota bacterium]|nr:hypothetical protein [Thermotogota bacterium]